MTARSHYVQAILDQLNALQYHCMQLLHGPLPPRGPGTNEAPIINTEPMRDVISFIDETHAMVQGLARSLPLKPNANEFETRIRADLLMVRSLVPRAFDRRLWYAYGPGARPIYREQLQAVMSQVSPVLDRISDAMFDLRRERCTSEPDRPLDAMPQGPVRKPDGWTRMELVYQLRAILGGFGTTTFDLIRKAAGINSASRGGAGAQRRFSRSDLRKLIAAVERGHNRRKGEIVIAWRDLLERG